MTETQNSQGQDLQKFAEASILGKVLHERSFALELADLTGQHFVNKAHRTAWNQITLDDEIVDEGSLRLAVPELTDEQFQLIWKSNHKPETVMRAKKLLVGNKAKIDLRKVIAVAQSDLDNETESPDDIVQRAIQSLTSLQMNSSVSVSALQAAKALEKQEQGDVISTKIRALDYVLYGGLHVGLATGLFSRYKVGKTIMTATLARNMEAQQIQTFVVSLERRQHDMEKFMLARSIGIDARDLDLRSNQDHKVAFAQYLEAQRYVRYLHRPGITISELRSRIVSEVQTYGTKVVFVDYWQLITNPGSKLNQQEKQQEAAQMLADLAANLDIAIVVTGQINQDGNPRGGEGILASAGIVVQIHRPEDMESGFLEAMVSNKGPTLSVGSPQKPSIELAQPGPHFRDYSEFGDEDDSP